MSTTKRPNKTTAVFADQKAIAGVQKYLGNAKKLAFLGTDYTPATLEAAFQAEIDALRALDDAKAQLKQQVVSTRSIRANARALRAALGKYVLSAYGPTAVQVLEDFGMSVPKNLGPRTAEAKAQAAAKAKATRKARRDAIAKIAERAPAPTSGVAAVDTPPNP